MKKFYNYLYGRVFTIVTDQPLISLFDERRAVPPLASSRIQRWALTLAAYHCNITFRPGRDNCTADAMSRLPSDNKENMGEDTEERVLRIHYLSGNPVTAKAIRKWTRQDPVQSSIYRYVMEGWPKTVDSSVMPYFRRRNELTVLDGCLLWGDRVVVPPLERATVQSELSHRNRSNEDSIEKLSGGQG